MNEFNDWFSTQYDADQENLAYAELYYDAVEKIRAGENSWANAFSKMTGADDRLMEAGHAAMDRVRMPRGDRIR